MQRPYFVKSVHEVGWVKNPENLSTWFMYGPIGYSHRIHSQKSNKRILNDVSFKKHDFVQNILREKFEEMRTTFIISRNSRSIHLFYSGSIT